MADDPRYESAEAFAERLEREWADAYRDRAKNNNWNGAWKGDSKWYYDNGFDKQPKEEAFNTTRISSFAGMEPPEQKWLDGRQTIPIGTVGLLTGMGGVGKTIIAMQLLAAVATKGNWLGYPVNENGRGVSLFYSGEEPEDQVHRRFHAICRQGGIDMASLDNLHYIDAVDEPGLFTTAKGQSGLVVPTKNYWKLKTTIELWKPDFVTVDNRGQVVEGDENNRVVAHQTMTRLITLARHNDCSIALLAHPSLTGLNTGTGLSGSTAWHAAARWQIHMSRPLDEDGKEDLDSPIRTLEVRKNQYDRTGTVINLAWDDGWYRCTDAAFQRAGFDIGKGDKARSVFLRLLERHNDHKVRVSSSTRAVKMYAPKVFSAHKNSEKITAKQFAIAMDELLDSKEIENVPYGEKGRGSLHLLAKGKINF